jgi:hypothetical protein
MEKSAEGGIDKVSSDILELDEIHTTFLIHTFYKNIRKNVNFMD